MEKVTQLWERFINFRGDIAELNDRIGHEWIANKQVVEKCDV